MFPRLKWRICRCAIARQKIKDPQVHIHPPEFGGSAGARSSTRNRRICRCAFTRPKMEHL